jgi:hypothetical protein
MAVLIFSTFASLASKKKREPKTKIRMNKRNKANPTYLLKIPQNFPEIKNWLLKRASIPFLSSKTKTKIARLNQMKNNTAGMRKRIKPPTKIALIKK